MQIRIYYYISIFSFVKNPPYKSIVTHITSDKQQKNFSSFNSCVFVNDPLTDDDHKLADTSGS